MKVECLQHVAFEGPAAIGDWCLAHGHSFRTIRVDQEELLPRPSDNAMLLIMGGPMSVNDTDKHDWLIPEIACIREWIDSGRPVLGICLGAQLIAKAMGAKVYPGPAAEVGWLPVLCENYLDGTFFEDFPESFTPLHWHGETFDLPAGARLLASSEAVRNQAFQLGENVVGLQFHLEATPESTESMLYHCGDSIGTGIFEQSPDEFRRSVNVAIPAIKPLLDLVLKRLTA